MIVNEMKVSIKEKEEQVILMRKEIEGSKFSYSSLMESNSNLQIEIN
jgi:hypothetical protein